MQTLRQKTLIQFTNKQIFQNNIKLWINIYCNVCIFTKVEHRLQALFRKMRKVLKKTSDELRCKALLVRIALESSQDCLVVIFMLEKIW